MSLVCNDCDGPRREGGIEERDGRRDGSARWEAFQEVRNSVKNELWQGSDFSDWGVGEGCSQLLDSLPVRAVIDDDCGG